MGFNPGGGGSGSIASSSDVTLQSLTNNDLLSYNSTTGKWQNKAVGTGSYTISNAPAGAMFSVYKSAGTWPSRPTSRSDITVFWIGTAAAPSIITSGTSGMLQDVDVWIEQPS